MSRVGSATLRFSHFNFANSHVAHFHFEMNYLRSLFASKNSANMTSVGCALNPGNFIVLKPVATSGKFIWQFFVFPYH